MAYYPFNGNANDESGNGNHGIVNGATLTADRHNTPNSAYQFDGIDDYIEIPHATSLNLTSGATISLWLLYQPQATHGYYALVEKSDPERGGHSRWGMWIQEDIAEFCIEPNEMNPIQRCLDSTTTLKVGEWHHIVGRYNGNLLYLTINGEPAGQSEFGFAPIARSNYSLFLGADLYQEDTVYLQGNLDNIRIYNRMLTDEEIERLGE